MLGVEAFNSNHGKHLVHYVYPTMTALLEYLNHAILDLFSFKFITL